ncbi:MAG: hypothetical protein KKD39_03090, partial [Candidatus Altiarchaeota archaeon]|nr:hypothetical protein [Candidatus Altiarchaeota archaeon]
TDINGPPIALFFTTQHLQKQEFRDDLVTFFLFLETITLAFMAYFNLVTEEVITNIALLLPTLLVGLVVGEWLFECVKEKSFHKIMLLIVATISFGNLVYSIATSI